MKPEAIMPEQAYLAPRPDDVEPMDHESPPAPKSKKATYIGVTVPADLKEKIREQARRSGMGAGPYLRDLALREINSQTRKPGQALTVNLKFFQFGPDQDVLDRLDEISKNTAQPVSFVVRDLIDLSLGSDFTKADLVEFAVLDKEFKTAMAILSRAEETLTFSVTQLAMRNANRDVRMRRLGLQKNPLLLPS